MSVHDRQQRPQYIWITKMMLVMVLVMLIASMSPNLALSTSVLDELEGEELDENGGGETEEDDLFGGDDQGQSVFFLVLQSFFYLIVVIALIYALVRFLSIRQRKMGQSLLFQNVGGISLGQNKSLQLVKMNGKMYMLGVGDHISLIKEITDEDELRKIQMNADEQDSLVSNRVSSMLRWVTNLRGKSTENNPFQTVFEDSLKKQKQSRQNLNRDRSDSASASNKEGRFP